MDAEEFAEYGRHIDQAIAALRKQLAMGNVRANARKFQNLPDRPGLQPELL